MANSSGLNERPSRTSLRGVATLYQGSINVLLRKERLRYSSGHFDALQRADVVVGKVPVPRTGYDEILVALARRRRIRLGFAEVAADHERPSLIAVLEDRASRQYEFFSRPGR